ncbi:MAG TPA: hypothetical protein VIL55_01090 [Naasia sp.]
MSLALIHIAFFMPLIVTPVWALLLYETTVAKAVRFFGFGCVAVLFGVVALGNWLMNPVVPAVEDSGAVGATGFLVMYAFVATLLTGGMVAALSVHLSARAHRFEAEGEVPSHP